MSATVSSPPQPSFLSHPRTPPTSRRPLYSAIQPVAGPSRQDNRKARDAHSSKSAPTSPAGRLTIPGLAPLSTISKLDLVQAGSPSEEGLRRRPVISPLTSFEARIDYFGTAGQQVPNGTSAIGLGRSERQALHHQSGGSVSVQSYQRHVSHPLPSTHYPQNQQHQLRQLQPHSLPSESYLLQSYVPQRVPPAQPLSQAQINPQYPLLPTGKSIPPLLNPAARIKTFPRIPTNPTSDTETDLSGNDSDATYRPRYVSNVSSDSNSTAGSFDSNGLRRRYKEGSQSQPDLTALRSRLEGWVGGVAKETTTVHDSRKPSGPSHHRRRTPPARQASLSAAGAPVSPRSKSSVSLNTMRKSSSPREPPISISPMTPLLSSASDGSSPREYRMHIGGALGLMSQGGGMTSEGADADDDDSYDGLTDSPSSGSISFSASRKTVRKGLPSGKSGLGLTFDSDPTTAKKEEPIPVLLERRLQQSSLLALRLLAIVPSVWGIAVLCHGFFTGELGVDVWPWGVDLSRDALERLVAGGSWNIGARKKVNRGDMLLAVAWAVVTAHFCFSLTTGLTYRWRSYYSLPSTLTRLLSLQCLCWPATYLTLFILGAKRPLLSWIVIGVTTGWSRTVQMWVTSNVREPMQGEITPKVAPRGIVPEHLGFWEAFTWGRTWDWDKIARKVGWKVGGLLLVTTAWLFWGLETGRLVECA